MGSLCSLRCGHKGLSGQGAASWAAQWVRHPQRSPCFLFTAGSAHQPSAVCVYVYVYIWVYVYMCGYVHGCICVYVCVCVAPPGLRQCLHHHHCHPPTWGNARQGGGLTCHHAARGGAGLDFVLGGFDLCR